MTSQLDPFAKLTRFGHRLKLALPSLSFGLFGSFWSPTFKPLGYINPSNGSTFKSTPRMTCLRKKTPGFAGPTRALGALVKGTIRIELLVACFDMALIFEPRGQRASRWDVGHMQTGPCCCEASAVEPSDGGGSGGGGLGASIGRTDAIAPLVDLSVEGIEKKRRKECVNRSYLELIKQRCFPNLGISQIKGFTDN